MPNAILATGDPPHIPRIRRFDMTASTLRFALALGCLIGACSPNKPPAPPEPTGGVACTKEAKICPDGSSVGRTGPNCEFAECPAAPADGEAPATEPGAAAAPTP
jgi:hypothetical protein